MYERCIYVCVPGSDIVFNRSESFQESLEHSMNPELQKVTKLWFKYLVEIYLSLLVFSAVVNFVE